MPPKTMKHTRGRVSSEHFPVPLSKQKTDTPPAPPSKPAKGSSQVQEASNISKKRRHTNEPTISSNPSKKAKLDQALNTAPSQKLDVYVFGSGENGELGLGHVVRNGKKPKNVLRPRLNDLLGALGVVQVAVGGMHCVAISHDHKILTWGVNDLGALGRNTKNDSQAGADVNSDSDDDDLGMNAKESTPYAVDSKYFPDGIEFAQVVASDCATFALTTTGTVYGWGTFRGSEGVIGFSRVMAMALTKAKSKEKDVQLTPILIPELKQIKCLAAGKDHILALDHKGNVFAWGCGEQNQLGRHIVQRTRANALTPTQFGLPKRKIKSISCGSFHSFAMDDSGRIYSWGLNNFGQTGISNGAGEANAIIETPSLVSSLASYKIKEIVGGLHHSIACTQDHKALVWGRCDDSQSGIPLDRIPKSDLILNDRNQPRILSKPTIVPDISPISVAAGIDNCVAITTQGEAYTWGFSANYRTGQGTEDPIEQPRRLENSILAGKTITFADCGGQFTVLAGPVSRGDGS